MSLRILENLVQGKDGARFMKYVPADVTSDQCWEWQSTISRRGYGKFWLHGRTELAHRASYRLFKGPIPAGLMVRHACDNPPCVNPEHLLIGTGRQNAADAIERGRYRTGASNPRAKLTESQVLEIRHAWAAGETQVSMARRFRVSRAAIQHVLSGANWKHIGGLS